LFVQVKCRLKVNTVEQERENTIVDTGHSRKLRNIQGGGQVKRQKIGEQFTPPHLNGKWGEQKRAKRSKSQKDSLLLKRV